MRRQLHLKRLRRPLELLQESRGRGAKELCDRFTQGMMTKDFWGAVLLGTKQDVEDFVSASKERTEKQGSWFGCMNGELLAWK